MAVVETTGICKGPRTYQAAAANQTRGAALVQGDADNVAAVAAAANAQVIGFQTEDSILAGDAILVAQEGEAVAVAGAAIAAGQYLKVTATGQLIPVAAAGDNVCARAVSSAAAANDWLVVLIMNFTYYVA